VLSCVAYCDMFAGGPIVPGPLVLCQETGTSFIGVWDLNVGPPFATLTGTSANGAISFQLQYTTAPSYGTCSGTEAGGAMDITCEWYLGDGTFDAETYSALTRQ
jgi:hypothetical protein